MDGSSVQLLSGHRCRADCWLSAVWRANTLLASAAHWSYVTTKGGEGGEQRVDSIWGSRGHDTMMVAVISFLSTLSQCSLLVVVVRRLAGCVDVGCTTDQQPTIAHHTSSRLSSPLHAMCLLDSKRPHRDSTVVTLCATQHCAIMDDTA